MRNRPAGDGERYLERKAHFDRCLTIYGRNTVEEALLCPTVRCERLHLADSNKPSAALEAIVTSARAHGAEILHHTREALSRISRNRREDQGIAADVHWTGYRRLADLLPLPATPGATLIAGDGLTNPQNLGMLIRSATAGGCAGILVPRRGGCDIDPLVIKASAGTLFRAPLLRCDTLTQGLEGLKRSGWVVSILAADAPRSLFATLDARARVFVLGGETSGVTPEIRGMADETLSVPMDNGVESLNVAVTAALVAYRRRIEAGSDATC